MEHWTLTKLLRHLQGTKERGISTLKVCGRGGGGTNLWNKKSCRVHLSECSVFQTNDKKHTAHSTQLLLCMKIKFRSFSFLDLFWLFYTIGFGLCWILGTVPSHKESGPSRPRRKTSLICFYFVLLRELSSSLSFFLFYHSLRSNRLAKFAWQFWPIVPYRHATQERIADHARENVKSISCFGP